MTPKPPKPTLNPVTSPKSRRSPTFGSPPAKNPTCSMEKPMLGLRSLVREARSGSGGSNSSGGISDSFSSSSDASDQARILIRAPAGRVVSLSTCAKICVVSFTIGVFVGFTLKRRLRRWAAKLLKRIKDD